MTDPDGEYGFGADVPDGRDSSELRRLAAEENAALASEHWEAFSTREINCRRDAYRL